MCPLCSVSSLLERQPAPRPVSQSRHRPVGRQMAQLNRCQRVSQYDDNFIGVHFCLRFRKRIVHCLGLHIAHCLTKCFGVDLGLRVRQRDVQCFLFHISHSVQTVSLSNFANVSAIVLTSALASVSLPCQPACRLVHRPLHYPVCRQVSCLYF